MSKTKVHIGTEPFMARTAIQQALQGDPRFETLLVPDSVEKWGGAREGDIVIVSGRGVCSGSVVIRLLENDVEVQANRTTVVLPYQGIKWLADLIGSLIDPTSNGAPTARDGPRSPPDRASPEEGSRDHDT